MNDEEKMFLAKMGKQIANQRIKKGLTRVDLAEELLTGETQIRRIEAGANCSVVVLRRIAKALSVPLSELVNIQTK
jgi:ribosome-binding protein aMBF1 (putative translation factor)